MQLNESRHELYLSVIDLKWPLFRGEAELMGNVAIAVTLARAAGYSVRLPNGDILSDDTPISGELFTGMCPLARPDSPWPCNPQTRSNDKERG